MAGERWFFIKEQLEQTPSRKCGIDADKELSYRQQAANFIQDMGQRLQVTQLCINTAIVYMHRFYTFHSFTKFHRNSISACAIFLAAKVEEQPRKLEHVIKVAHMCLHRDSPPLDTKSDAYQEQAQELVFNENLMLQTLGFDIGVEHPHTSVVKCCQLVRASKELAQTAYFMATNSLHLTTMCLQYRPTVVACVCIHLACKWSSWEIPRSSEGKDWFYYVDPTVTLNLLEQLTSEFLAILDKCPSRLKRKIMSGSSKSASNEEHKAATSSLTPPSSVTPNTKSPVFTKDNKPIKPHTTSTTTHPPVNKPVTVCTPTTVTPTTTAQKSPSPTAKKMKTESAVKSPAPPHHSISYAAYREKKDKERQAQKLQQAQQVQKTVPPVSQKPIDITVNVKSEPNSVSQDKSSISNKPLNSAVSNTPQLDTSKTHISREKQINLERQRQIDARNKLIKPQNQDHLWENGSKKSSNIPVAASNASNSALSNYLPSLNDSLGSYKPPSNNKWEMFSNDDDSSEFRRDIVSDLKMEFSDNESNDAMSFGNLNSVLNLGDTFSQHDNSESKSNKSLDSINQNEKPSFMSIFATQPTNVSEVNSLPPKNTVTTVASAENSSFTNSSSISTFLSKPPPPLLSPLRQDVSELDSKNLKPKSTSNLTVSEISDQKPPVLKNQLLSPKQKESPKGKGRSPKGFPIGDQPPQQSAALQSNTSFLPVVRTEKNAKNVKEPTESNSSYPLSNNQVKLESLLSPITPATPITPSTIFPNLLSSQIPKESDNHHPHHHHHHKLHHSPHTTDSEKPAKDKDRDKHREHRHHKSKHKKDKKHKHKEKDKDRHKSKDKDKERHRESRNPDLKVVMDSAKDAFSDESLSAEEPRQGIKLKISKKQIDEPVSDDGQKKSLKIVIPKNKLSTLTPKDSSPASSPRKRKSSPKHSSKREKVHKRDGDMTNETYLTNPSNQLSVDKNVNNKKKASEHMNVEANLLYNSAHLHPPYLSSMQMQQMHTQRGTLPSHPASGTYPSFSQSRLTKGSQK